jgi:hypothetical protein
MVDAGAGDGTSTIATKITVERGFDEERVERFLEVYRISMEPLEELAACRQSLTDEEFRVEMSDPSTVRYVGWEDDVAVALFWMTTDLTAVPWISPRFYAKRFPDLFERNLLFYISGVVVLPEARGQEWSARLFEEGIRYVAELGGASVFDCSTFVVDTVGMLKIIEGAGAHITKYERHDLDQQHYFAYTTHGRIGTEPVIDLRDGRTVLDLTD